MCKKLIFLILVLGLSIGASADVHRWLDATACGWPPTSDPRDWTIGNNWHDGACNPVGVPGAGDDVWALGDWALQPTDPCIPVGYATPNLNSMLLGRYVEAVSELTVAGTLNVTWFDAGYGEGTLKPNVHSIVHLLPGGAIDKCNQRFALGDNGGRGELDMQGGTIGATLSVYLQIGVGSGIGHAQLDAGTLYANKIGMREADNGDPGNSATLDLNGGILVLDGDWRVDISPGQPAWTGAKSLNYYISQGWITAYGGEGQVVVDYNSGTNKTTVSAAEIAISASEPIPGDEEKGVTSDAVLSWLPGPYAQSREVYFGTNFDDVNDANSLLPVGGVRKDPCDVQGPDSFGRYSYDPGTLELENTYYWRIDEVNDPCTWRGEVWSFTTFRDIKSDSWVATDALGRELLGYTECGPLREDKFVGIFYFLWLGFHTPNYGPGSPYDITKLLAEDPCDPAWGPENMYHHWGESELGYYNSTDEYVIRKHAHMLADAGVDVLILDATNGFTYNYLQLCDIYHQIRNEGGKTPQICFMTWAYSPTVNQRVYDQLYSQNLYPELWFKWDGKPLLLTVEEGDPGAGSLWEPVIYSQEVKDFFTFRYCWSGGYGYAGYLKWQWMDTQPNYGWEIEGVPEELAVPVASHPVGNPYGISVGRSYNNGVQPPHDIYGLSGYEDQGLCFTERWQEGLQLDPEFIFIAGWNEWVGMRNVADNYGEVIFLGEPVSVGDTWFGDSYNQEYSRDAEPMKGGHTDNYYHQMVDGIRRFKGVRPPEPPSAAATITIDGTFSDWNDVGPEFRDTINDTTHRDSDGFVGSIHYTNSTGRNDLVTLKVARDDDYVYFYAETRDNITSYTDPNWMMLFIDADQNNDTGWEGYDYLVNASVVNSTTTTLQSTTTGWNWSVINSGISYRVFENKLEIRLPRSDIGQGSGDDVVAFDFHWADNIQNNDDIIEFAVSGDSAPNRRFNYRYDTSLSTKVCRQLNPMDLNGDCDINWEDLTVIAADWLSSFDFFDFAELADDWLERYTPDSLSAVTLLEDDFEGDLGNWNTDWDLSIGNSFSPTHSIECSRLDNDLVSKDLNTSGKSSIRISFKYKELVDFAGHIYLQYYNGSSYDNIVDLGSGGYVWQYYSDTIYNEGIDTQYFIDNFRIKFEGTAIAGTEFFWVDDVLITVLD